MEWSLQDRIRERAYELWNAGGRMDGHAEQYWLAAERELLGEMAAQLPAALKLLVGNAQVRKLRPSAGRARKADHTTVISRRSSGAKMALGMRAWTPRTMSTTCVTRKLTAMLQSA